MKPGSRRSSISINESYIHIIEVATGKTETITPRSTRSQDRASLPPSHDGRRTAGSLYYLSDQGVNSADSFGQTSPPAQSSRSPTTFPGTSRSSI